MPHPFFAGRSGTLSARCALMAGAAALMLPAFIALSGTAHAQNATLPPVEVMQKKPKPAKSVKKAPVKRTAPDESVPPAPREAAAPEAPASGAVISSNAIATQAPASSDTAQLLGSAPGVSLQTAGGVSALPVMHGMASDRIKVMMNGMIIAPACANHMNPPLSYFDPAQVKQITVQSGVTPVSTGGDSIAGSIVVDSLAPRFAAPGQGVMTYGSVSAFGRSNGEGLATSGTVSAATSNVNLTYSGGWSTSGKVEDGRGNEIRSTEYESQNHMLSLGIRGNGDLLVIEGGVQHIPYQGFPNQWMDMTLNEAWFVNARYEREFRWGRLDARGYYQNTRHKMDFLEDKSGPDGSYTMPMDTHGVNFGYSLKAELPVSPRDLLKVGSEFHGYRLDDWWPAVPGSMMMGPDTYWNINGGSRDRLGTFAEWEHKWTRAWTTLVGVRNDVVWMDTGKVQAYSSDPMMGMNPDADAATEFNARKHARTDVNFDITALTRYEPNANSVLEAGYARKSRSPNLYERYAWGRGEMAMEMTGWFGDGNGYVGNLDLKPEVAHTLSITTGWHDRGKKAWEVKVTPYYTYVEDYIGATRIGTAMMMGPGFALLQFTNRDAELYGVDVSGRAMLGESSRFGKFALTGVVGYVHGEYTDGGSLYHMMPINAKLALIQKLGNWTNSIETQLVGAKSEVDRERLEDTTPAYALVNLRSSYQWNNVRFDLGVENLFDKFYYAPLGGVNLGDAIQAGTYDRHDAHSVPGLGRTVYGGVTVKF